MERRLNIREAAELRRKILTSINLEAKPGVTISAEGLYSGLTKQGYSVEDVSLQLQMMLDDEVVKVAGYTELDGGIKSPKAYELTAAGIMLQK